METVEYLGITGAQAQELKNALKNNNGNNFTAFEAMTPANYEWINENIDTAIRAGDFRKEKFFKLWLIHHFKFPAEIFFYSHRFLPELTKKLMKYNWPECHKKKPHFNDLDLMNCTIGSLIDESLIDQAVRDSAAEYYKGILD